MNLEQQQETTNLTNGHDTHNEPLITFGQLCLIKRESLNIPQHSVAKQIGIAQSIVSRVEKDDKTIQAETLLKFFNYYRISFDELKNVKNPPDFNLIETYLKPSDLGSFLLREREKANKTRDVVSKEIGVSKFTLMRAEKNISTSLKTLKLISDYYDIPVYKFKELYKNTQIISQEQYRDKKGAKKKSSKNINFAQNPQIIYSDTVQSKPVQIQKELTVSNLINDLKDIIKKLEETEMNGQIGQDVKRRSLESAKIALDGLNDIQFLEKIL